MRVRGIPDEVDLGLARIPIVWLSTEEMRIEGECEPDDTTPDGLWDVDSGRIFLRTTLSKTKRRARQIYLHELSHACLDLYHDQ